MKLYKELKWRGFVNQTTFGRPEDIDKKKYKFYFGVDPSSDSMTIGNLASAMMVRHFIEAGHKAVLLVGGATGLIGDPDGKTQERELISQEQLKKNRSAITSQYEVIFSGQKFEVVDNLDWFRGVKYIDFLRDVGKHVPTRQMMAREFVRERLKDKGGGISYAEFSYALMQAYDFLHLFKTKNVSLQLCGSDQWGNSVAGVDLIRRVTGKEAHVWSAPLVVNKATGVKFGKTEADAIWLDEKKTSAYQFYQFWLNVEDENVEDYLKVYTLLGKSEIEKVLKGFSADRKSRLAQKTLAYEVTKLIHGENRAKSIEKITRTLFESESGDNLESEELKLLEKEIPSIKDQGSLTRNLVKSGLSSSNSEANRLIKSGAVRRKGKLIKVGKNKFAIVR